LRSKSVLQAYYVKVEIFNYKHSRGSAKATSMLMKTRWKELLRLWYRFNFTNDGRQLFYCSKLLLLSASFFTGSEILYTKPLGRHELKFF